MPLSNKDVQHIKELVELGVRQYFDTYLNDVFPKQIEAVVKAHDDAAEAHGGIRESFGKFKWTVLGFVAGGGLLAGATIERLFGLLQ